MMQHDRSVLERIDADYTFLTGRLARFYQLDELGQKLPQSEFCRVTLPARLKNAPQRDDASILDLVLEDATSLKRKVGQMTCLTGPIASARPRQLPRGSKFRFSWGESRSC